MRYAEDLNILETVGYSAESGETEQKDFRKTMDVGTFHSRVGQGIKIFL